MSADTTNPASHPGDNTQKDPKDWVTGNEPATGAQKSYLKTLGQETGEKVPEDLTKAEASEKIEELKKRDPRVDTDASAPRTPRRSSRRKA
jgi:hypothetical protein